jgi:hypothetical protein
VPDRAHFGPEYFLAFTLPDFKSRIFIQHLDTKKDNGPTLFNLMVQCFQDVGLPEWTSVVANQCLNDAQHTKADLNKCIRDTSRQLPSSRMSGTN